MAQDDKKEQLNKQQPYGQNAQQQSTSYSQLKQQQDARDKNLQKLSEQLNKHDDEDDKDDRKAAFWLWFKRAMIILLVLLLLAGVGIAIYFFTRQSGNLTTGATIKLSTHVTEMLSTDAPPEQSIYVKQIFPGDKFSVTSEVRNADSIHGDSGTTETAPIFVRYKITLEMGGKSYNNVVVPVLSAQAKKEWHVYNPLEEVQSYVWDGWYYYYGAVYSQEKISLFHELQFDFYNTTNIFGGKDAKISVTIEAVEADVEFLGVEADNAWSTAPVRWIENMKKGQNNHYEKINVGK